jgi:hypothetical protein
MTRYLAVFAVIFMSFTAALSAQEGGGAAPSDEEIMSPEVFERYVAGTTLYFSRRGAPYGAEQYFDDRRVIWSFFDGTCERGAWYSEGDMICFAYETQSSPQCWNFLEKSGEKRARVIGADPANDLVVAGQDQVALSCPGPGVGVSYSPAAER